MLFVSALQESQLAAKQLEAKAAKAEEEARELAKKKQKAEEERRLVEAKMQKEVQSKAILVSLLNLPRSNASCSWTYPISSAKMSQAQSEPSPAATIFNSASQQSASQKVLMTGYSELSHFSFPGSMILNVFGHFYSTSITDIGQRTFIYLFIYFIVLLCAPFLINSRPLSTSSCSFVLAARQSNSLHLLCNIPFSKYSIGTAVSVLLCLLPS